MSDQEPLADRSVDVQPAELNLTKPAKDEKVGAQEVPQYSAMWAKEVRPFTRAIFTLLAAVLLIPFLFVFVGDPRIQDAALDWAKTILAPAVGFASAVVGYYYGTRHGAGATDAPESQNSEDES